ncbi:MAG TPA: aspartate carbamoyltransferase [Candidatus Peribacterales bacterium]|nr:aspartate carbamoyltransferase [Candidatus Peribacterales bacterium]
MPLPFKHLTSSLQLTPHIVESVFKVARKMETILIRKGRVHLLKDKVVALLFYEASSRTMLSFQAAVQRLGGGMILAHGKHMSSLEKGESLEDTIRMVHSYADLIVMRHPEAGSAARATAVSDVPFINGGDGGNEHPTQSLLDLYTLQKALGRLSHLHLAFACDPLHSRTIRSLALILSQYEGNKFTFIGPESVKPGPAFLEVLAQRNIPCVVTTDLRVGTDADVLYMNRLQEERFEDRAEFEKFRTQYKLTAEMLKGKNTLVMDPLPRVDEIAVDVDPLPNAAYFRQARNGLPIRMALLAMMLGKA